MPQTDPLAGLTGLSFRKMTGSGNDFVVFDARETDVALVTSPAAVRALCHRTNGIGADGVVVLHPAVNGADARVEYLNSDGSAADLCGNATLCSAALTVALQLGTSDGLSLWTDAGIVNARVDGGVPEIDLNAARDTVEDVRIDVQTGEHRIGYTVVGVPHLVVMCNAVENIDLERRGGELRRHAALGVGGANVNFVSRVDNGAWRYRTFERGVEGETLACGTGAVATAVLLAAWGQADSPVELVTSSGRPVTVTLVPDATNPAVLRPSLRGEGRVVYRGIIENLGGSA